MKFALSSFQLQKDFVKGGCVLGWVDSIFRSVAKSEINNIIENCKVSASECYNVFCLSSIEYLVLMLWSI